MPADPKTADPVVVSILAFHEGGGIAFVAEEDKIFLLRIVPGMAPSDSLEVVGTINSEHAAFVGQQLAALVVQENVSND